MTGLQSRFGTGKLIGALRRKFTTVTATSWTKQGGSWVAWDGQTRIMQGWVEYKDKLYYIKDGFCCWKVVYVTLAANNTTLAKTAIVSIAGSEIDGH